MLLEIGVTEHAVAGSPRGAVRAQLRLAKPDAGIVEPRRDARRLHVDTGVAVLGRRVNDVRARGGHVVCAVVRGRAGRGGVVHGVRVPHIRHRQDRAAVERGHRRFEPAAHSERAACIAAAIHRLREDRVGVLTGWLDDDVEGLGERDPELIDRHRVHGLSVGGHHRHAQGPGFARRNSSSRSR